MAELLVELYSEPLPPWAQKEGSIQLARLLRESLEKRNLLEEGAKAFGYATARRIAARIEGVLPESKAQEIETRGPREGANEKALTGFLHKAGFSSTEDEGVELRETPKGKFWFATSTIEAKPAEDEISFLMLGVINAIRWKKSMRWETSGFHWPRPLRHHTIMLDETPLPIFGTDGSMKWVGGKEAGIFPPSLDGNGVTEIEGVTVDIPSASEWEKALKDNGVQFSICGVESAEEIEAIDTPAFFAERPCILTIHPKAEGLPDSFVPIILQHHLSTTQNPAGGYDYVASLPHGLSQAEEAAWRERAIEQVEKVAEARLDDALFYWQRDKELGLEGLYENLDKINFHPKLGSVRMHADRVSKLALLIAKKMAEPTSSELSITRKATLYAKADLASETVSEIPELRGEVGSKLFEMDENLKPHTGCVRAAHGQLDITQDMYLNFVSYDIQRIVGGPSSYEIAIGLATELDFLLGFMGVGERATGSSDPYGLRQSALRICQYLLQLRSVNLFLDELLPLASNCYAESDGSYKTQEFVFTLNDKLKADIIDLLEARLVNQVQKNRNVSYDVALATMHAESEKKKINFLYMLTNMLDLQDFFNSVEAERLILAWRRAQGLLKESNIKPKEGALSEHGKKFDSALEQAEKALEKALKKASEESTRPVGRVEILSGLSEPVSDFLDAEKVLVGTEQEQQARLALLDRFIQVVKRVADLDYIEGGDITARKDSARLNQG